MATIIGCLLRASIGVHTKRKIRGQISVFTIRKNPQISLSVFQQQNGNLQTRTPRTCETLHYWQSQESQDCTGSFEKTECECMEANVNILCLNFYFSFLSFLLSEAPQMPQCIHESKRKWSKLCLPKCIQYQNASVHGRTRLSCKPQHHVSLTLKGNTSVEDFLGRP